MARKKRQSSTQDMQIIYESQHMRFLEILLEKINGQEIYQSAHEVVDNAVTFFYNRKPRRGEEESIEALNGRYFITVVAKALELLASKYKDPDFPLHLRMGFDDEQAHGGHSMTDKRSNGAEIQIYILPYHHIVDRTYDPDFIDFIVDQIADIFSHEMVHYIGTAKIAPKDQRIWKPNKKYRQWTSSWDKATGKGSIVTHPTQDTNDHQVPPVPHISRLERLDETPMQNYPLP